MGAYRLELSSTNRAGCQNKECKDARVKIQKGELRVGTWVDTERIQSFFWRHWGCVTPRILAGLNEVIDEATSEGQERDYDVLDGWEELPADVQAKVRRALEQGHVDDEEWNGDIEMNRPGMSGYRKRAPNAKKGADAEDDKAEASPPAKAKPTSSSAAAGKPKANSKKRSADEAGTAEDDKKPAAAKKTRKPRAKKAAKVESSDEEGEDEASTPEYKPAATTKRGRAVAAKNAAAAEKGKEKKVAATTTTAAAGRKRKAPADPADAAAAAAGDDGAGAPAAGGKAKRGRKAKVEASVEKAEEVEAKPKRGRKKKAE